jgi:prepilin-type N-terminal cleavage/methylation domain-containing protein
MLMAASLNPQPVDRSTRTTSSRPAFTHRDRRAFSLTELLVVIAIIVLLVGILLVAMKRVQANARKTQTSVLMESFLNSVQQFQTEHERLPGIIPDDILAQYPDGNGNPQLSSTENALLDLNGGCRVVGPFDQAGGPVQTDYNNFQAAASAAG